MRRQGLPCRRTNKKQMMAVKEILFKELPFRPAHNQVFYIENGYDTDVNSFIRNNYLKLKSMFRHIDMDFYYLPYLLREHDIEAKVRYYAPYLSPKLLVTKVQSNAFVPFISDVDTKMNLQPSLIFDGIPEGYYGDTKFKQLLLSDMDFTAAESVADLMQQVRESHEAYDWERMRDKGSEELYERRIIEDNTACEMTMPSPADAPGEIKEIVRQERGSATRIPETSNRRQGMLSRLLRRFNMNGRIIEPDSETVTEKTEEELAEEQSLIETAKVLRELRMTVQRLRLEGVSLMAIHEFIDKQEPLSRMIITPDYHIFLPDYNHMEIEMGALPKAVYFLFLRYPEGIIYKHMPDYYNELLHIYQQLRPNTDDARLRLTITKVVNPLGNALNENIARIRKAFVEKFDEHLANNYIITGERGSQYSIPLDRDLITWEWDE